MSTAVFDPKPLTVDESALKNLEGYAKAKGMTLEDVLGIMIDSFRFRRDPDGRPEVSVNTVYRPKRSAQGRVILPAEWDDPADAIYDHA